MRLVSGAGGQRVDDVAVVDDVDIGAGGARATARRGQQMGACSPPRDPDRRGDVPRRAQTHQPATPISKTSNTGTTKAPNGNPCAIEISR